MSEELKSPWPGPKGLIPVTSGKAEDANVYTRNYLDQIRVEMRVIDSIIPDLTTEIWGETYSSPIMTPAFSHLNRVGEEGKKPMTQYALAAKQLNVLNWVGMEPDEEIGQILETGAKTVRIIKPFQDHDRILAQIRYAKDHGAVAVGVDVDHIVGEDGLHYDNVDGLQLGPVLQADLAGYAWYAKELGLPFVAKGVMSVQDALKAKDAGCSAVVVSHHHGRIPFGIAPAQVLPRIRQALEGSGLLIFADCHVDTGYDAYKLMALGADAVSAGRSILSPLLKEGTQGVIDKMSKMNGELSSMMMYTDVPDVHSFDASVLYGA